MRGIGLRLIAGAALLLGAGVAAAQTSPPTRPQSPPPAAMNAGKISLTEEQAESWINKPVFSRDGKEVGEVAAFKRSADNAVLEMHIDIGGLLGLGETRVTLRPAQFELQNGRVLLNLTE